MERDADIREMEDRLAEAQAQIEALQASAADAEARAATARAELAEAAQARKAAQAELDALREELSAAHGRLRETALKYREARLASAPDIPGELVPESDSVEEIEREFEAAQEIVGRVRERVEREVREQARQARVPAGSPARRAQDLSGLSPAEKIRLGLEQRSAR